MWWLPPELIVLSEKPDCPQEATTAYLQQMKNLDRPRWGCCPGSGEAQHKPLLCLSLCPGTGALPGSRISPELTAQAGQSEISLGAPGNPAERPQEPPGMDLVFVPGEIPVPCSLCSGQSACRSLLELLVSSPPHSFGSGDPGHRPAPHLQPSTSGNFPEQ